MSFGSYMGHRIIAFILLFFTGVFLFAFMMAASYNSNAAAVFMLILAILSGIACGYFFKIEH